MVKIQFIGPPGSGKSTLARQIDKFLQSIGYPTKAVGPDQHAIEVDFHEETYRTESNEMNWYVDLFFILFLVSAIIVFAALTYRLFKGDI